MITTNDLVQVFRRLVAPLERRVRLMVARGVLELIDNTQNCQILQVTVRADQLRDDVERFQEYGFSSVPKAGAEALVMLVSGSSDHPVVVATEDRRYRPTSLVEGEACLYTLQNGIRVLCKSDGSVLLGTTPTDFVALATPTKAEITALRTTVNSLVTAFNAHTHVYSPGPLTPAPTAPPATPASAPAAVGDVKATEVKAK